MRKPVFILFVIVVLTCTVSYADEFYESQLNSGIRNSETASYILMQEAETGSPESVILLNRATAYSPDLPAAYFELAKARASFRLADVLAGVDYVVSGINAYLRNFWWSFSLAGGAFLCLIFSCIAAVFIIAVIRSLSDLPLLFHEILESSRYIALLPVLFVLSLISPLLFLAGLMVALGVYMSRVDRILVYLFLFFLLLSPFFFRVASQFLIASSSGTMKAVAEVNESKGNAYALDVLKTSNGPVEIFSHSLALKRTGAYDEAIAAYNNLIRTKADARTYVNLGNAHFGANNHKEATINYLAAVSITPLASAYYNLSGVAREGFDFERGNEFFGKALEADRNAVSRYSVIYARNPNRIVIDETLPYSALWAFAWSIPGKMTTFNLTLLPAWMLSPAALLLIAGFYLLNNNLRNKAYRCKRCNSIFCPLCEKHIMWGQMCPQCFRSLIKLDETEVRERVARLMSIYEHQKKRRGIMKALSFVLPGAPQVYGGKILYGFLFMWPFIFFLLLPLATLVMSPDAQGRHWLLNWISLLIALVLLVISNIFTRQRISKGWL